MSVVPSTSGERAADCVYRGPRSPWVSVWIWVAGGLSVWVISLFGAIFTAADIAEVPQPNQQLWVAAVRWSALLPIVTGLLVSAVFAVFRRRWRVTVLSAAHGLLWPSLGLIFLWVPK